MEKSKSSKTTQNNLIPSQLKKARNLVNKILKNLNHNEIDWTVQVSINSFQPERVNYCAQIEAPANGLQPLTWVCSSWDELLEKLTIGTKVLDQKAVEKAYHEAEIQRAEALVKYHKEQIEKAEEES